MKITLEQTEGEPELIVRGNPADPRVQALLAQLGEKVPPRLMLYRDGREYFFDAGDVAWFSAEGDRVTAHVNGECYEARARLYELAEQLRARSFVQISKGILVNVGAVRSVEAEFSGNYTARLRDGKTSLIISRFYMKAFRKFVMGGQ